MISAQPYSRRFKLAFLAFLVLLVLFSGLGIHKVRAQSEADPANPTKAYADLFNWSWSYEMFGYAARASFSLRKITPESQPQPQKENAPSSEQHSL